MTLLWQGMLLGLSVAAPVGPIGILCIQRTLAFGRLQGLLSGLGAATADAIYGCIAALGLSAVAGFLAEQQDWIRIPGGIVLCLLAYRTLIAKPPDSGEREREPASGRWTGYWSTLLLTLANPLTIISFAGIFAGFSGAAGSSSGPGSPMLLVAGVFLGSALWWLALSSLVAAFRKFLSASWLKAINVGSGIVLLILGISILWRAYAQVNG
ncbi:LysE family translocator [Cohnella thailandensis]|uniref:LysE family translocator n=1 Tax=Cohnella thailandensis TaxID=557557 RepID=A0A841SRB4_9BACL|nr:LysE family translocator [Cohnella thailandensis]MBB6633449.1 LysE family translocator [Cohnella thailandensis]MBP1974464.1 threonine/homoserine/homoserine lactone efflux protein [Cohnella thailandensis]